MKVLVTELNTGKIVHRGWYQQLSHVWEPTAATVATWFECEPHDVDLLRADETEDGPSDDGMIAVNGKPVATMTVTFR